MRGVTRVVSEDAPIQDRFQPALPMRGVTLFLAFHTPFDRFQPALPMRGVTASAPRMLRGKDISTRTPHAGSDVRITGAQLLVFISTRTPHAGSDFPTSTALSWA